MNIFSANDNLLIITSLFDLQILSCGDDFGEDGDLIGEGAKLATPETCRSMLPPLK